MGTALCRSDSPAVVTSLQPRSLLLTTLGSLRRHGAPQHRRTGQL
jgi:hypothetical protein